MTEKLKKVQEFVESLESSSDFESCVVLKPYNDAGNATGGNGGDCQETTNGGSCINTKSCDNSQNGLNCQNKGSCAASSNDGKCTAGTSSGGTNNGNSIGFPGFGFM